MYHIIKNKKMKKTYIVPETEVVNIELENMIAASKSLSVGGGAGENSITNADINEIMDWIEFEESNNSSLW